MRVKQRGRERGGRPSGSGRLASAELAIEPVRRSADASLEDLILGDTVVETERRVMV